MGSDVRGVGTGMGGGMGRRPTISDLAAAAGAPGVVLFGPTDPDRWRPLGRTTVIRRESIDSITTREVLAALRNLRQPR